MNKTGVLLINLGTPVSPTRRKIKSYLREFLSDPRVLDLHFVLKFTLVNLIIVPFRSYKTKKAYKKIWFENNRSPLEFYSHQLITKLRFRKDLARDFYLAMRYGQPNIASTIEKIISKDYEKIVILPLYPQYASSSSGSAIAECLNNLKKHNNFPTIKIINNFYQHPSYIDAQAAIIQNNLLNKNLDHIIFSYHSIPLRQLSNCCHKNKVCDQYSACPVAAPNFCYRSQCYHSTLLLAEKLKLDPDFYSTGFQSRLGKSSWVGPDLESILHKLRLMNYKNIGITCPSFVADCLETLEEIEIRLKKTWHQLGGDKLVLAPCLNDDDRWVEALVEMIK